MNEMVAVILALCSIMLVFLIGVYTLTYPKQLEKDCIDEYNTSCILCTDSDMMQFPFMPQENCCGWEKWNGTVFVNDNRCGVWNGTDVVYK